jgi:hypothetical protein
MEIRRTLSAQYKGWWGGLARRAESILHGLHPLTRFSRTKEDSHLLHYNLIIQHVLHSLYRLNHAKYMQSHIARSKRGYMMLMYQLRDL